MEIDNIIFQFNLDKAIYSSKASCRDEQINDISYCINRFQKMTQDPMEIRCTVPLSSAIMLTVFHSFPVLNFFPCGEHDPYPFCGAMYAVRI